MNIFEFGINSEIMTWKIIFKYWYIFIPVTYILFLCLMLNSTHLTCKPYNDYCTVQERFLVFVDIPPREVSIKNAKNFYSSSYKNSIPILIGNDGYTYRIHVNSGDKNELLMESYHNTKDKTEKIVKELNQKIENNDINLDIKF